MAIEDRYPIRLIGFFNMRPMKRGFGFGLLISIGMLSNRAFAEAPAATPPAAAGAAPAPPPGAAPPPDAAPPSDAVPLPEAPPTVVVAPDIVRLKNGGILRGTISELVPGEYVTIVLITGETRTIPVAEVRRAGLASAPQNGDPPPAVTPAPAAVPTKPTKLKEQTLPTAKPVRPRAFAVVHAAEARVDVVSAPQRVTLFRRAASAGADGIGFVSHYDELCTAPCKVSLSAGKQTFALARSGDRPREADAITLPAGRSTLKGTYIDRSRTRLAVLVAGGSAVVGGVALLAAGVSSDKPNGAVAVVGGILTVAGSWTMCSFYFIKDGAEISVSPGAPSAVAVSRVSAALEDTARSDARALRDGFSGLTLSAKF